MSNKPTKKKVRKSSRQLAAAELGRRGGKAVAKKHGKGYMKELGKRGAQARWNKD